MTEVIPPISCNISLSSVDTSVIPLPKRVRLLREDLRLLGSKHDSENNETVGIGVNNSSSSVPKSNLAVGSAPKIADNFRPRDTVLALGKEQCRQDPPSRNQPGIRKRGRGRGRKRGRPPGRGRKRRADSQTKTSTASELRYTASPYSTASWTGVSSGGRLHRVRPLDHERKLLIVIKKEELIQPVPETSPAKPSSEASKPMALNTPSWRITTSKLPSDIGKNQNSNDVSAPTQPDAQVVKVVIPKPKKRGRPKGKTKRTKAPRGWKRPPRYIQCSTVVRGTDYDIDSDVSIYGV